MTTYVHGFAAGELGLLENLEHIETWMVITFIQCSGFNSRNTHWPSTMTLLILYFACENRGNIKKDKHEK